MTLLTPVIKVELKLYACQSRTETFMTLLTLLKTVELNYNDCDLEVTSIARYVLIEFLFSTTSYYTNKPEKLKIMQC